MNKQMGHLLFGTSCGATENSKKKVRIDFWNRSNEKTTI